MPYTHATLSRERSEPEDEKEAPRGQSLMDWALQAASPGTLITVLSIVLSAAVQHGVHEERANALDVRLTKIENTYVPRSEHATKDQWLVDELKDIKRQLAVIEESLLNGRVRVRE